MAGPILMHFMHLLSMHSDFVGIREDTIHSLCVFDLVGVREDTIHSLCIFDLVGVREDTIHSHLGGRAGLQCFTD